MSHSAAFAVQVDGADTPCPVVSVCGEVDLATAPQMDSCIAAVLASGPRTVVLNLSKTTFMDCSGLAVLLGMKAQLPAESVVMLHEPKPFILKILGILGLDSLISVEASAA